MKNKIVSFLKKELFEFNPTFLSGRLEERLKYNKVFSELLVNLRKRIVFYLLSFTVFCIFLAKTPYLLQNLVHSIVDNQNQLRILGFTSLWVGLFLIVLYTMQLMKSYLLRDIDFFVMRIQVAARYAAPAFSNFNYTNLSPSALVQVFASTLAFIPIVIMYYALAGYLSGWIVLPIFLHCLAFFSVFVLHQKNVHFLSKTNEHYQKDVKFFLSIGKYLSRIKKLAFDVIIKKQILSFSETNSFLYQKIFENSVVISGIKYCIVFLVFALNSILFLSMTSSQNIVPFLSVLFISLILSYCFLSTLKIFTARDEAKEIFKLFRYVDSLNFNQKIKEQTEFEDENQNVVSFENASFIKDNQVIFHQINQHLKKNDLIAVIGSNQDERSNYLSACVGHLQQIGGRIFHTDQYEFLPKTVILFDGTIRENILGLKEYNHDYYQEVIDACALKKDFDCFAMNDLTKISPSDPHLSGSLLKKIGIARVIYAKSAVSFFDDPFANLSQSETTKIFFDGFQKLLAGTTRIFSTDRIEYAALSDDIVLCRGGKILEQGSHVSLLAQNGIYARMFYAGAENKRFEILQAQSNQDSVSELLPSKKDVITTIEAQKNQNFSLLDFEEIIQKAKKRFNNISYFFKMFFPVFVSKNFYAFFTFLTLSIWASVYSFYFIFENLTLNSIAKISILFMCFSIIASTGFAIMLAFYKNVYATCAYIIENVARMYFARFFIHGSSFGELLDSGSSQGSSFHPHTNKFDWHKEHILLVTGRFYSQLLNALIVLFFCLAFTVFISTITSKIFVASLLFIVLLALFVNAFIQTKLFYDAESSKKINTEFREMSHQFFTAYHEPQSQSQKNLFLERLHAKLYGFYFLDFYTTQKKFDVFKVFGMQSLWENYTIIENMIYAIKSDSYSFRPKTLPDSWPEHGVLQLQNVKFNSDLEEPINLIIPVCARFMYMAKNEVKNSVFIEKLRLLSPIVSGEIKIDGEDISLCSQQDLRRHIGYVSQTSNVPFVSIREHLDPYNHHDDVDVWEVLTKVGLSQHVALLKFGLSTKMEHVPQEMFWSGEVLLFSLARCILNNNKIICIDSIEAADDVINKISQIIQSECKDSTVIFSGLNDKFKDICTMHYSEFEDRRDYYSLNSETKVDPIVAANTDENEIQIPTI